MDQILNDKVQLTVKKIYLNKKKHFERFTPQFNSGLQSHPVYRARHAEVLSAHIPVFRFL